MNLYPVFLKLRNKKCVVIGGGTVAERKVGTLLCADADVTVISPQITKELRNLHNRGKIRYVQRKYRTNDIEGSFLVIASTNSRQENRKIYLEAEQRNIPVNVVDDPENSSFFMPSVASRGNLQIALSTSGTVPYFAKRLRHFFEKKLYPDLEADLESLSRLRRTIIQEVGQDRRRKEAKFRTVLLPKIDEILEKMNHESEHDE